MARVVFQSGDRVRVNRHDSAFHQAVGTVMTVDSGVLPIKVRIGPDVIPFNAIELEFLP